jgi:hypothetical protein
MGTQLVTQIWHKGRGRKRRLRLALGAGLALLFVAAITVVVLQPARDIAPPQPASRAVEIRQQEALAFVRAHLDLSQPEQDAAQQGVAGYLRAHGVEASPPPPESLWTPAARAVYAYLRAHGK